MRAKPKIDIGVIINGFGIGIARRSTSRSSPHSIVGDIQLRPTVSPNYDVHTRGRPSVCQAAIRVALISLRRCVMSVKTSLAR